jgi:hypothetical protein
MNFIKKLFEDKADEATHMQLIRFGKGEYRGRAPLVLWKTKKIKVKSGFEFANDLVKLCAGFGKAKVSGIVLSKEDISEVLSRNNIKGIAETKKGGLYYQNNISEQELNEGQILALEESAYFSLLDMEGEGFKLKIKKKLPKPGKSENKIDDKFCQLEADERFYGKVKEDLFWDLPDCKKAKIVHNFFIEDVVKPEGETDYAKIREMAKRKGKVIREADVDGKVLKSEAKFVA